MRCRILMLIERKVYKNIKENYVSTTYNAYFDLYVLKPI